MSRKGSSSEALLSSRNFLCYIDFRIKEEGQGEDPWEWDIYISSLRGAGTVPRPCFKSSAQSSSQCATAVPLFFWWQRTWGLFLPVKAWSVVSLQEQ